MNFRVSYTFPHNLYKDDAQEIGSRKAMPSFQTTDDYVKYLVLSETQYTWSNVVECQLFVFSAGTKVIRKLETLLKIHNWKSFYNLFLLLEVLKRSRKH